MSVRNNSHFELQIAMGPGWDPPEIFANRHSLNQNEQNEEMELVFQHGVSISFSQGCNAVLL